MSHMETNPANEDNTRQRLFKVLFESETGMDETLSTVTTFGPGGAVVCRARRFHIPGTSIT